MKVEIKTEKGQVTLDVEDRDKNYFYVDGYYVLKSEWTCNGDDYDNRGYPKNGGRCIFDPRGDDYDVFYWDGCC